MPELPEDLHKKSTQTARCLLLLHQALELWHLEEVKDYLIGDDLLSEEINQGTARVVWRVVVKIVVREQINDLYSLKIAVIFSFVLLRSIQLGKVKRLSREQSVYSSTFL